MLPILEWGDTVIDEASGPTPHHGVTVFEVQAAHAIGATFAAPIEYGRQAERNRDDRSPSIILITVLVQAEFGAGAIPIDQARVGIIVGEPGLTGSARSDV